MHEQEHEHHEAISGDPSRWFGRKLQVALDGIGHVLGDGTARS